MLPILSLLLAIAALALAYFWVTEFVRLMLLTTRELRGEYDKVVWAAVFILLFPLAPFAFRVWRYAALSEREAERSSRR